MCCKYSEIVVIVVCAMLSTNISARNWNRVMEAIIQVESNGNPKAVNGDQVGCMQIRPIMVKDCNRILKRQGKSKRFTLKDRYSVSKSKEMFIVYQSYYNPKGNIERAIRMWNGGCKYSVRKTNGYYKKVINKMKNK